MWLSNTSTTAMVMPIAEAVLQQLICTGLADSHADSETAEAPEDDSGTSSRRDRPTVASIRLFMSHISDQCCSPQPSRRKKTTWRRSNWSCSITMRGTPVDLLFRAEGSEFYLNGICINLRSPSSNNCTKQELSTVTEVRAGKSLLSRPPVSKREKHCNSSFFDVLGSDWRG